MQGVFSKNPNIFLGFWALADVVRKILCAPSRLSLFTPRIIMSLPCNVTRGGHFPILRVKVI
jgi:hypothetical protein